MQEKPNKKIMSDMVSSSPRKVTQKAIIREEIRKPVERIVYQEPEVIEDFEEDFSGDPQETAREKYRDDLNRPKRGKGCLLWVVILGCVLALIIGIGGLFAHASIYITPKTFSGDVNMTINFSQSQGQDIVFFATATQEFTDTIVVPATGSVAKESKASGKIRFYNANLVGKVIPAGTQLISTAGIKYQTAKSVTIPAKKGTVPGSAEIGIIAVESGSQANIDPDDFLFVNQKAFANITARSVAAITGGAKSTDMVADPVAIEAAKSELASKNIDSTILASRIEQTIPDGFIKLPIEITTNAPNISVEPGHEDGVHVIARQTVGVIVVRKSDIARMLGNQMPVAKEVNLTLSSFDGLTFISSAAISASQIPTTFSVRISGKMELQGFVDNNFIKQSVPGMMRREVKKRIMADPAVESVYIRMTPPWRRMVPIKANDTEVIVMNP